MNVQPYFPEPIEVPGNIAAEPYGRRLQFIRRTVAWHWLSGAAIAWVAVSAGGMAHMQRWGWGVLAMLVLLSLVRTVAVGSKLDLLLSSLFAPFLVVMAGLWLAGLHAIGWPVIALGIAVSCAGAYTLLCGRDFSFLGLFGLATMASIALVCAAAYFLRWTFTTAWVAALLAVGYLLFYAYDLASLLQRRRPGEEPAAAVDLYRDVLNFIGYSVRVIRHWRRYRFF